MNYYSVAAIFFIHMNYWIMQLELKHTHLPKLRFIKRSIFRDSIFNTKPPTPVVLKMKE